MTKQRNFYSFQQVDTVMLITSCNEIHQAFGGGYTQMTMSLLMGMIDALEEAHALPPKNSSPCTVHLQYTVVSHI